MDDIRPIDRSHIFGPTYQDWTVTTHRKSHLPKTHEPFPIHPSLISTPTRRTDNIWEPMTILATKQQTN
jgi:hypothetical protein